MSAKAREPPQPGPLTRSEVYGKTMTEDPSEEDWLETEGSGSRFHPLAPEAGIGHH